MIKEFIELQNTVALITCPRRFGKTLNMTMIREFFDVTKDSRSLLEGLAIMHTEYADQINKTPVIYFSFKDCTGADENYLKFKLSDTYGRGGISETERISGISRKTIRKGIAEIKSGKTSNERIRKDGGDANPSKLHTPTLKMKFADWLMAQPMMTQSVLSYTTESLCKIKNELNNKGIKVGRTAIAKILDSMNYSRQQNQKMQQIGEPHPDRNAQFEHINKTAAEYLEVGNPVISVDTKKKENIENFENKGSEYRTKKEPRKVLDHDFPIEEFGKISPYGVYNLNNNTGFVNVGTSHDTSEFAVESISRWWESVGKHTFPNIGKIYITCDSGGSNGYRVRMWKHQLQQFANRTGLVIEVFTFRAVHQNGTRSNTDCFVISQKIGKAGTGSARALSFPVGIWQTGSSAAARNGWHRFMTGTTWC